MLGNLLYTIKQCHSADVQRKKMLVQVNMIGSSEFSDFSYKLVSTLVQFREEFLDLNFKFEWITSYIWRLTLNSLLLIP